MMKRCLLLVLAVCGSALVYAQELPRSAIGKVLKRELRAAWEASHHGGAPKDISEGAAPQSR